MLMESIAIGHNSARFGMTLSADDCWFADGGTIPHPEACQARGCKIKGKYRQSTAICPGEINDRTTTILLRQNLLSRRLYCESLLTWSFPVALSRIISQYACLDERVVDTITSENFLNGNRNDHRYQIAINDNFGQSWIVGLNQSPGCNRSLTCAQSHIQITSYNNNEYSTIFGIYSLFQNCEVDLPKEPILYLSSRDD